MYKEVFLKTIFEEQGVEYRQVGDYMLSNIALAEQKDYPIGMGAATQTIPKIAPPSPLL